MALMGSHLNPKDFAPTMFLHARVAELADARDLGSRGETLEGSSPSSRNHEDRQEGFDAKTVCILGCSKSWL
jgi:hypothetical protein